MDKTQWRRKEGFNEVWEHWTGLMIAQMAPVPAGWFLCGENGYSFGPGRTSPQSVADWVARSVILLANLPPTSLLGDVQVFLDGGKPYVLVTRVCTTRKVWQYLVRGVAEELNPFILRTTGGANNPRYGLELKEGWTLHGHENIREGSIKPPDGDLLTDLQQGAAQEFAELYDPIAMHRICEERRALAIAFKELALWARLAIAADTHKQKTEPLPFLGDWIRDPRLGGK